VTLFRGQGADNVTWLWTVQADESGTGPIASWWPGADYVTWVGIDGYYYRASDNFNSVFGQTIEQVRKVTSKPVLLSETAIGLRSDPFVNVTNLFNGMVNDKTLGLVWFDKDQQGRRIDQQDWRIEDDPLGKDSFQAGTSNYLVPILPSG
jgi:mannan endo-1,4-beta-mannosidase